MSDNARPQPPAGVTDPLLWRLAAEVVEAHQPDETGHCDNLLCDHQEWPCQAAQNAERALTLSGVEPREDARRDESPREMQNPPHRRSHAATEAEAA